MTPLKLERINKLHRLLIPETSETDAGWQANLKVLQELAHDVNLEELRAYMLAQRELTTRLEEQQADERKIENPFKKIPAARLIELTEYSNHLIAQGAKLELARRNFFYFCNLRAPNFYQPRRGYLVRLCGEMQEFLETLDEQVMIIALPPRHGKSRTAGLFAQWVYGNHPATQIMTGSYNVTLSTTFSKTVRNDIQEQKADPNKIVYSDVFPGVRIQRGDGAMNLWSLEGQYASYLATSPDGTATGFGATLMIIDDLIKKALEAFNEGGLDELWRWFTDTMLSRLEEGGKIIIIMTRWANRDLAGRAKEYFSGEGYKVREVVMKALQEDGTMLCPEVLSRKSYDMKTRAMSEEIASANYQQIPIDLKGRLYQRLKTYDDIPRNEHGKPLFTAIKLYSDTADTGGDYLCSIIYGEYLKEAYVLDVYYTKAPMEETEPETAKRVYEHAVRVADIESNNGGRGFARAVERILREKYHSNRCKVRWFHQSQNKRARILTNATWVQEHIYFPSNWRDRWPEYYDAMMKYQKEGKNAHDDAQDCTTGIAEKMGQRSGITILR